VADDGPGFEPAMLIRAFQPFASSRPDHLTGLGLYLIKVYLNSLGGETHVESTADGATVRLLFPAVP
jgi:signal transduction histidine kinase